MKIILVFLCVAPFVLSARAEKDYSSFDSAASPETKSRFAMLDDVRILANGLLQLGHGLKDFVHKTKGQMNDIFQKLYIFDRSFYELSLQTSEIKEEEEQLRQTTARLQINNEEIKNLSQEMNSKIEDLIQNKIQLQEKVWGLEDKVTKLAIIQPSTQGTEDISSLKVSSLGKVLTQSWTVMLLSVVGQQKLMFSLPPHCSTNCVCSEINPCNNCKRISILIWHIIYFAVKFPSEIREKTEKLWGSVSFSAFVCKSVFRNSVIITIKKFLLSGKWCDCQAHRLVCHYLITNQCIRNCLLSIKPESLILWRATSIVPMWPPGAKNLGSIIVNTCKYLGGYKVS